jgi:uncharacterized membrane protein
MAKLPAKGLKWLKGCHLITVSCWISGGFALVLLYFLKNDVADGNVLYGISQSAHHVDWVVVIIPGAFGLSDRRATILSIQQLGFLQTHMDSVQVGC